MIRTHLINPHAGRVASRMGSTPKILLPMTTGIRHGARLGSGPARRNAAHEDL